MVVIDVSEHICAHVTIKLRRSPDHLHSFIHESYFLVLIVDPREEKCLEAHSAEERGGGRMMSEGINVPGYIRN